MEFDVPDIGPPTLETFVKRPRWSVFGAAALLATASIVATGPVARAAPAGGSGFDVYEGTLDAAQWRRLGSGGMDLDEIGRWPVAGGQVAVELVLGREQAARLAAAGVPLRAKPVTKRMRTLQAQAPKVFRPYGGPGGIEEELTATATRYPRLAKLETVGRTLRGVPMRALKVTVDAPSVPDGRRPSVLYLGGQHAREWITPEMTRRLMHRVLEGYGTDPRITKLLAGTELWFMPVGNPDGYDMTFQGGDFRYVRKNLRDNNGDGKFGPEDGVDLNRNFAEKWGYDNEGSSTDPGDDAYRGPAPGSEPETRAMDALFRRIRFRFMVNYHSAAQVLLWGTGWQVSTVTPDDQIAMALAGDHADPAIPGSEPEQIAQMYTSNGDTDTHAQVRYGTIAFAPEMSGCDAAAASDPGDQWEPEDCRTEFDFPDDEKLIQAEYAKNVPFAMSVAESAKDPAHPVTVTGRGTEDLVPHTFADSYGSSQQVAVVARRPLRDVRMHYRIDGGAERTVATREWRGGKRYGGEADKYFAELRGTVPRQKAKDKVTVWFSARGGRSSRPADVYDMDWHGRRAPDALGVLSHYRAVVWETGDDVVPRDPGQPESATTRATAETDTAVRDYLNEGGKLLYAGQYANYAENSGALYRPEGPGECETWEDVTCQPLSDDLGQYWLGAGTYVDDGGTRAVDGRSGEMAGFHAPTGAQQHTASFLSTSSELPPAQFLQFTSGIPMTWHRDTPGPYDPATGERYLFSGTGNASYKRLTRTVDLTGATAAHLRFKFSRGTDGDDFLFVEAHEPGRDNWTTLPDTGGLTTTDTGFGCQFDGVDPYPFLAHYWGPDCGPQGTTGRWNAVSGPSGGWKDFDADLSAYAGKRVEISISDASDRFAQGFGVFLDDARIDVDGTTVTQTSFENDLGGWTVPGPPPGPAPNRTDWTRSGEVYDFGAATSTPDTLYLGFGLEKLSPPDRDDLVARALRYLLPR
jgi:hypothetical protein